MKKNIRTNRPAQKSAKMLKPLYKIINMRGSLATFLLVFLVWTVKRLFFGSSAASLSADQSYLLFRLKNNDWHNPACFLIHQGKWWGYAQKDQQFKTRGLIQRSNLLGTEYCLAIDHAMAEKICTENNGRKFKTRDDYLHRFCKPALLKGVVL